MKKLLTVLTISILFGVQLMAQQNNNLVIFSNTGDKFWVILNGVKQNAKPETNVKITGLIAPNYKGKIIFENKGIPDLDQNIYLMDGGNPVTNMEFTYSVSKTKKGYKLKGVSMAAFTSTPVPDQQTVTYTTGQPSDMTTTTTINTTGTGNTTTTGYDGGGTVTQTTTTTSTGTGNGNVGMNVGVNTNGTGFNMNVNVNDGTGMNTTQTTSTTTTTSTTSTGTNTSTTGTGMNSNTNMNGTGMNVMVTSSGNTPDYGGGTTTTTNTNSGGTYSMPGYNGPYGCPYPMSPADFESAKKSISSKSFDDTKLTLAKQIINSNCLLSTQVKEVMLLFSFEDTRLDLAKYSYGRTYDQGNYYKLNDAFTFDSSVDDLNKYIESKK